MPEGDTLFKIATTLRKALVGSVVTQFETSLAPVAEMHRQSSIVSRRIHAVEARGKHLLILLRDDSRDSEPIRAPKELGLEMIRSDVVLHTHLRMTGSWHIYRPGEAWQKPHRLMKVALHTEQFVAPCFSAPVVELMHAREAARHRGFNDLGPDAITDGFDAAEAKARILGRPEAEIGVALMNQRLMAGVGNVYKSEVLFIRRVNPFRAVGSLGEETIDGLVAESHRLLMANRTEGNRRTMSHLGSRERLWVYGRVGQPCRVCRETIRVRRQGLDGRTTYYCAVCQRVNLPW